MLVPAILFVLLFFTPNWIFTLFFTEKYAETTTITKALSFPFIIYVFLNLPFLFLLYTVKKTGIILFGNIIYFLTVTIGCLYLIPRYGVFGPPWVISLGFTLALIIGVIYSIKEYRKITL